jgi:HAD superfamily hydrolase (TIGR01509 family)
MGISSVAVPHEPAASVREIVGTWDLVIFDNDGVLVDSEPLANRVLAGLLTEHGYPISPEQCVRRFMGRTLATVRAAVEDETGTPLPADFESAYYDVLFEEFRRSLRRVAGVEAVLATLERDGTPVCVASSARHEKIRVSLDVAGLAHHFGDRVFSAQDVRRGKPAPDLFLHAAANCGVEPERCLVIEDSPPGIRAAKAAAGMTAIGYVGLIPADQLVEAGADIVIDTMDRLLDAMAQLSPDTARHVVE